MIFLPHTNTVILLEPYCGTITEPGLPVVIPTKDAYDVLMYSPLGDTPFFCFELYYIWEIAFSPTKDEDKEYNCISANIVHEVLKHVSDISWGYDVRHI